MAVSTAPPASWSVVPPVSAAGGEEGMAGLLCVWCGWAPRWMDGYTRQSVDACPPWGPSRAGVPTPQRTRYPHTQ